MAKSLSPFLKQANIGEFDTQRVAIACVTYIRMYEAQLNSRMYEARLRQHSFRDSLIFFPILKWSRDI
jgi:hypothetical protein